MTSAFYDLLLATLVAMTALLIASDSNAQSRRPAQGGSTSGIGAPDQSLLDGQQGTLAQCMSYWDSSTQMSKSEWRETCRRTQNGLNPLGTSEQPIRDTTKRRRDR